MAQPTLVGHTDCTVFVSKDLAEDWHCQGARPARSMVIYDPDPEWDFKTVEKPELWTAMGENSDLFVCEKFSHQGRNTQIS